MPSKTKPIRQSVSLPSALARRVRAIARDSGTSMNRTLVGLIEAGLVAQEQEKLRFLALADRLASSRDPKEQARLKEELARITFGD